MKNHLPKSKLLISTAIIASAIATAESTPTINTSSSAADNVTNYVVSQTSAPSYTASGTMSKKTALMLTNLLKNPHLTVKAIAGKKSARSNLVTYTITGKTSRANALKLKQLLQSNQEITMNVRPQTNMGNQRQLQVAQQQRLPSQNLQNFPGAYQPFYYYGRPPLFVQGNIVWYPIPALQQQAQQFTQAPYPMDYAKALAKR